MDKDYVMYIILFTLISLGAYRDNIQKDNFERRIRNTEQIGLSLTVKQKQLEQKITALQLKMDSIYLRHK